jgi:hypothetical protein
MNLGSQAVMLDWQKNFDVQANHSIDHLLRALEIACTVGELLLLPFEEQQRRQDRRTRGTLFSRSHSSCRGILRPHFHSTRDCAIAGDNIHYS